MANMHSTYRLETWKTERAAFEQSFTSNPKGPFLDHIPQKIKEKVTRRSNREQAFSGGVTLPFAQIGIMTIWQGGIASRQG